MVEMMGGFFVYYVVPVRPSIRRIEDLSSDHKVEVNCPRLLDPKRVNHDGYPG